MLALAVFGFYMVFRDQCFGCGLKKKPACGCCPGCRRLRKDCTCKPLDTDAFHGGSRTGCGAIDGIPGHYAGGVPGAPGGNPHGGGEPGPAGPCAGGAPGGGPSGYP